MKVGNLYDIQSFDSAVNIAKTFDGEAGILLPRQLEHISSTIYQQKFAELTFLNSGITVNNEGGVSEFITKLKNNVKGDFADAGNTSDANGKISLETSEDSIKVIMKKAHSAWSEVELQQAQQANRNLPGELLGAHNTRYNQLIDSVGYIGKSTNDGLLNFAGFNSDASANTFDLLTGLEMYNEIKDLVNTQRAAVNNDPVFGADRVVVPNVTYSLLNNTILNSAADTTTVREALEKNLSITIVQSFRATTQAVAFSTDARAMVMRIPMQLRVSNIYQKGFDSYVESMFRIAGLDVIENQSGFILTGVAV